MNKLLCRTGFLLIATGMPALAAEPSIAEAASVEGFVKVEGGALPSGSELRGLGVSTFYIGKYEVQCGEFREVRTWGAANGYDIGRVGAGTGTNYPVTDVNWHQALKWCNARSEKEGKTPVYNLASGAVYRTGDEVPVVNPLANGYRLPTEKEWEWAARGGRRREGTPTVGATTSTP